MNFFMIDIELFQDHIILVHIFLCAYSSTVERRFHKSYYADSTSAERTNLFRLPQDKTRHAAFGSRVNDIKPFEPPI